MSSDYNDKPGKTSGPSLPIHGPQTREPFNRGVTPGRDAPGMGAKSKDDANPFTSLLRSPYGDQPQDGESSPTASFAPSISLPTGGGALRSIGEKFSPNPFTGGGSMSVPIASSPGRGGFGPSLGLSYNSGLGNGPFGLGWMLGVPAISRKTDKGLPEYRDRHPDLEQRDTFVLAGAEDLVHVLDGQGAPHSEVRSGYVVERFRPRVEGGFARIERWTSQTDATDVYWRTITPDNVTSYFGKSTTARVSDPADATRVFSWFLEESHDDRGNIVLYEYKQEDLDNVDQGAPEERTRLAEQPTQAQRYLKRIKYGNGTPFQKGGWLFEVVLDYGEHGTWVTVGNDQQLDVSTAEDRTWPTRADTFSTHRAGFELRTRRLCRRVLMFHHFSSELGQADYLVASTDFVHDEQPELTRITGVIQRSYRLDDVTGDYETAEIPTLEFDYSPATVDPTVYEVTDKATLRNLPAGIDGRQYRLVDLDGEGLPGIVTESAGTWYFKRGLGDGRFGGMLALPTRPANLGAPGTQLMDLDGDGCKELVSFTAPTPGFFRRTANEGWANFRRFTSVPNIDWADPRLQLIDLSGDGFPDVMLDRGRDFVWYRSKGVDGFESPRVIPNPRDERSKPVLLHADARAAIQLADMTGDGLVDLVRIRNGEVLYWANCGHGRFGPPVRMRGLVPFAKASDLFDPSRIRMADVDGSGTTDILYLHDRGATLYRNQSGNAFAAGELIGTFPGFRSVDWAEVVDVKGTGTACLVWSTSLSSGRGRNLRYVDLMSGQKPHLLIGSRNNMGAETKVAYAPSTKFYLADKAAGKPWATKLPFPVQVVERVEAIDHVTRQRAVQHFAYHHGYFDGQEREFRGFGMVETWDTESFEDFVHGGLFTFDQFETVEGNLHQPPVHTKSWFHTGAFLGRDKLSTLFASEYWAGDTSQPELPDTLLPTGLTGAEAREAIRALAGSTLRSEVYALDGSADEDQPYTVSTGTFEVRQVQPRGVNRYGVYLPVGRESLSIHYERNHLDPRVAHSLTLEVDDYGTPLRSASVVYPRRSWTESEQGALYITLSESDVVHLDTLDDDLRLGLPTESRGYELHNLTAPANNAIFTWQAVYDDAGSATAIDFEDPVGAGIKKRLLSRGRVRYMANDLSGPLTYGTVQSKALGYDSETMVMTDAQFQSVFGLLTGVPTSTVMQNEGGYLLDESAWWVRSGHPTYDASKFYAVTKVTDPFGNEYTTTYDSHTLLTVSSSDPLGNSASADHDYRLLTAWQTTDANGNRSQVAFDVLGFVEKSAVLGKVGGSDGDTLSDPTSSFEYDLFEWQTTGKPNWAKTRVRETHGDPNTAWLEQYSYFSGAGGTVMVKAQARPGMAPQRDVNGDLVLDGNGDPILVDTSPSLRWIGNGRTVLDNKGNVVKAYEPYHSSTHEYEDEDELVEQGVTAINHYDPLGRLIRTDLPNGTFSTVEFDPWRQRTWDANDNVVGSSWYTSRVGYLGADPGLQEEDRAAVLAAKHDDTPAVVHLDTLGRPFLSVAENKDALAVSEFYETRTVLDISGNVLEVEDARDNTAETRVYGMAGQSLKVLSEDAGDRWHLRNALGQPLRIWDDRNQRFTVTYDTLRRPVDTSVSVSGGPEKLLGRVVYGDDLATPSTTNHVGRVYRVYDGAGAATTVSYDFKGQVVSEERYLVKDATTEPDWSVLIGQSTIAAMATAAAPKLETTELFTASSTRDALGRVLTAVSPDDSTVTYTYDEGGGLKVVELNHRGSTTKETVVGDITYDAKGQREQVVYGTTSSPTTTIDYTYDPDTYRLSRLKTTRGSDSAIIQSLHYHYDPVGNIMAVRDTAQQTVYFQNTVVDAANGYEYDALYRLIEATGREHSTQGTAQRTHTQLPTGPQPMTSDPSAMRRYTQTYAYDEVGNITKMVHTPSSGTGWTRHYQYATAGNRLLATSAPGDTQGVIYTDTPTYTHTYAYDAHGSMTSMPHISSMVWGHGDQLQKAVVGTENVYFQYAGGSRSRKYVDKGGTSEERIYLGGWEVFRKRTGTTITLERETLHLSDGSGRICMVETKTVGTPTSTMWRYQLGNHLGSATTEVTKAGSIISYEEYHPYGTSAYRAVDSSVDVSAKRYRYTGMERDEETGLGYHTARYYVPWLGRWSAADPIGLGDGVNRFRYASNAPSTSVDLNGGTTLEERIALSKERIASLEGTLAGFVRAQHVFERTGDMAAYEEMQIAIRETELAIQSQSEVLVSLQGAQQRRAKKAGLGRDVANQAGFRGESKAERIASQLRERSGAVQLSPRAEAALGGAGAGAELGVAVKLVRSPNPLGRAAGVVLLLHSFDTVSAASETAKSGEHVPSNTESLTLETLPRLGVPDNVALGIYFSLEVAAGAEPADFARLSRVSNARHMDDFSQPIQSAGQPHLAHVGAAQTSAPKLTSKVTYGRNELVKLRKHSQHMRETARRFGVELPRKPGKPSTQAAMRDWVERVVLEGETRQGAYMTFGNAIWSRLGDGVVVRKMDGEFITYLDYSKGGVAHGWDHARRAN